MDERQGAVEGVGLSKASLPNPAFWAGKRVLLTGHTGLKGGWAALWLAAMGAKITGFALAPDTEPSLFQLADVGSGVKSVIGDLRDEQAVRAAVDAADPEIVLHLAAQPLVRRSIVQPIETFATNIQGTAHLLNALRERKVLKAILVVTSDKVYLNDQQGRPFVEGDELGGKDPYAASKAATEIVTRSFAASYFDKANVPVATARAGNIIGGGDFAEDRLVPDIVRAIQKKQRLVLRHPEATRPWQHVLDCVTGYLLYAEALAQNRDTPRALNFGPQAENLNVSVAELAKAMLPALGAEATWDHVPVPGSIEMKALSLDSALARKHLNWTDRLGGALGVTWTADWYRAHAAGSDMRTLTRRQIADYQKL